MPSLKVDPNQHKPSALRDTLTGTCSCGSVRITLNDPSLWTKQPGRLCHSANGRKVSGSYNPSNLDIEESKTHIEDPRRVLKMYFDLDIMSGRQVDRYFCSNCGCPIMSRTALLPGRVILNMGLSSRIPPSGMGAFELQRHPWQGRREGVAS
ncbi:Mss4-like protein [Aspergillus filifer]